MSILLHYDFYYLTSTCMLPKIIDIPFPFTGHLTIYSYGLMMALGFLAAYYFALWRAKKEHFNKEVIANMWLWSLVAGIIGARAYFVIQHWQLFRDDLPSIFFIWQGGLVWQGGLIMAIIASFFYLKYKKVSPLAGYDIASPATMLGLAFGRVGCLLNGCCYGKVCNIEWLPWPLKLTFPRGSYAYLAQFGTSSDQLHSQPVYATQIYSIVGVLIICAVLQVFFRRRKNDGEVFVLMAILYGIHRFIIEFFRDEPVLAFGLTDDQILCIAILVIGAAAFAYIRTRKRQAPAVA